MQAQRDEANLALSRNKIELLNLRKAIEIASEEEKYRIASQVALQQAGSPSRRVTKVEETDPLGGSTSLEDELISLGSEDRSPPVYSPVPPGSNSRPSTTRPGSYRV